MADVLLTELSNADIDWIVRAGQQQKIAAGSVLLHARQHPDALHLLLEGALTINTDRTETQTGHPIDDGCGDRSLAQLRRGEIVGETTLLNLPPMTAAVRASEDSLVLSIGQPQLAAKLLQDNDFAAHFYRAIALILSDRLRQFLEMPGQLQAAGDLPVKEALFIFGGLRDSDIDWLVSVGQVEKLTPGRVLIHAGRPIDALYIILDGLLSLAIPDGNCDPLSLCFQGLESTRTYQQAIANLSRGEMAGTISFLDFRPLPTTVRAVNESLVLAIPRQRLATQLQQDLGFAARFYRALAVQLANSLQQVMGQLGCGKHTYSHHQPMDEGMDYDDELDVDALEQLSQGAARFNWMLKQLGVFY